ncbi:MAG: cytosine deaminase [Rhodobacteraceae bacterium]|nr:cytosine deaminase [Paracoccaceae bacterium]
MTFDLIIQNATLFDGHCTDIAITGERIAAVESGIAAETGKTIDVGNRLVSQPFVDPHFHMDATLSYGIPRRNTSGTLFEGIRLWGELKPLLTHDAVRERALRYCDWAAAQGLLAIRSHVDVCDDRLLALDALIEVRSEIASYIDLQLVAFPQDGHHRSPNGHMNLLRALDRGADVIGGIPHFEQTMADGTQSVIDLCRLAEERGLPVDLHCDETDDPMSRHIEQLVAETRRRGMAGRVTGSHLTSMHGMDSYYVSKLLPMMAEAGVAAILNPLVNIVIQGRQESYPRRRGLARVPEMIAHGIAVGWGQDCVLDPWYSLGKADMLDVAHMGLHVAQMTSLDDIRHCFRMVTEVNAQIMGLNEFGLQPGKLASMVVLDANSAEDAVRLRAERLMVISRGRIIARRPGGTISLDLPGRPSEVTLRHTVPDQDSAHQ